MNEIDALDSMGTHDSTAQRLPNMTNFTARHTTSRF